MSDRIADGLDFIIYDHLMEMDLETQEQERKMETAIESLKWIAENDRQKNGDTPTDKLVKALDKRDKE